MYRFQANASWFEIIFNTAGNKETKLVCRLSKVVSTARPQPFVRSLSKKLCAAKRGKRKCSSSRLWIRRVEERRRERVERRENRDNRPLSCRSWSYVFLLLRHHCLLQPRSNSLAHFYFVTTSISIVQPIRPFVPLRGYTGQYFDAAPSNDQLFFSSFEVNRATRYLIHRCISYFQLLCSQFLFVRWNIIC